MRVAQAFKNGVRKTKVIEGQVGKNKATRKLFFLTLDRV